MADDHAPESSPAGEAPLFEKKKFSFEKRTDRPELFQDFDAWQEARRLSKRLYEVTAGEAFAADANLRDQLRRSVVLVMTHLAEGIERGGDREFGSALGLAKAAVGAVRSQLFVAADLGLLSDEVLAEVQGRATSLSHMIGSQLGRLKRAETSDFKKKPFGKKPGGFGPRKEGYGGGEGGPPKFGKPKFGGPKFGRPKPE